MVTLTFVNPPVSLSEQPFIRCHWHFLHSATLQEIGFIACDNPRTPVFLFPLPMSPNGLVTNHRDLADIMRGDQIMSLSPSRTCRAYTCTAVAQLFYEVVYLDYKQIAKRAGRRHYAS